MLRTVEGYWHEMFYTCAKQLGVSEQWGPWHEPFFHFVEGDQSVPLFSAINTRESRVIQIDCWMESTEEEVIHAFTKTFGESFGNPVYMLEIGCLPTEETVQVVELLLKIWLAPGAIFKNLNVQIDGEHFVKPAS